ncbi:MAG: sulfur oxidation c-type cytochrome SoxA [Gammaproteobacteria bacterium]|nr:sulfur oxidation c-type cytochrome SoxA [Gammaproteobacteria bacterium]
MRIKNAVRAAGIAAFLSMASHAAQVQPPEDVLGELIERNSSDYLTQSEQNIMMMPDNPALWTADEGEALFREERGPNNTSLETCDLGKGPGVVEGVYVELPRYFEDTGRVMDLESRLVYCMTSIQGFSPEDPEVKTRHGSDSDMMKLQTFIASRSSGLPWNPPMDHPLEKAMRDAGEVMFYRRAGTSDFSCATCHTNTSKRIRASVLPNINEPHEWTKAISWPAFRVGQQNVRSSTHRIRGCYWQMRQPQIIPGSDAAIALMSYWTDAARGQPAILPDKKR